MYNAHLIKTGEPMPVGDDGIWTVTPMPCVIHGTHQSSDSESVSQLHNRFKEFFTPSLCVRASDKKLNEVLFQSGIMTTSRLTINIFVD